MLNPGECEAFEISALVGQEPLPHPLKPWAPLWNRGLVDFGRLLA